MRITFIVEGTLCVFNVGHIVVPTHFLVSPLGKKKATSSAMAGEDLPEGNTRNIIKLMIDQLPKDVCQMLEECNKQHDEEGIYKRYMQALKSTNMAPTLSSRTLPLPLPPHMHLLR
jgi:hypothetical protein